MALFGQPYPIASEKREKLFGYSRPGGRLNAFDHELLSVSREFGSRQALAQRIAEYVNGKPALFGQPYVRDNDKRREVHFNGKWSSWDNKLSAMTGEFYAIGGGAKVDQIKGDLAFEGGPGIRYAVLAYAQQEHAALLDPADRLQSRARMDFGLRHDGGLGAEALDD